MEKFIATVRGIVVVAVFLLLPLVPPVGVDEASAHLEEALDLLELCLDQVDDVLRFCDPS